MMSQWMDVENTGVTRSGKPMRGQPVVSKKPFNMLGRAMDVDEESVLFTDNQDLIQLAVNFEVKIIYTKRVKLADMYELAKKLSDDDSKKRTFLLIDFGPDWLYMLPAPLSGRGSRKNAAAAKPGAIFVKAENEECGPVSFLVEWKTVPANGSETPTRESVMGASALNYAAKIYDNDFARGRSWEWLHLLGHSLGGDNKVGNLVAGTYTANTQMIPHEKKIKDALIQGGTAKCLYSYECYPLSWVGMFIEMDYEITLNGKVEQGQIFANCTGDLPFDKFQYSAAGFR
jgi:hypothetical protein